MKLNNRGFLFGAIGLVPSILISFGLLNIGYSAHITPDFREKRAVEICEFDGGSDCEAMVSTMSKNAVKAYIRDDGVRNVAFYSERNVVKNGGGLRRRILASQR